MEKTKTEKIIQMLEKIMCITIVKRILCVILLAFDIDKNIIAEKLELSLKSIKKYETMFENDQTDELMSIKPTKRKSELENYKEEIFAELEAGEYKNLRQIQAVIERVTGLKRSRNRISEFLKKNGYRPIKVGFIPSKANPEEQRSFYENTLKPLIDNAKSGKIQLFFVDASHFVMGGFAGTIWAKIRRMVKTASGRSRYNVLGALNFVTKKVETITNDSYIRSDSVIALIDLLIVNSIGVPIKLILDNASYQRCNLVKNYAQSVGVELIFLPTYSPNLNLIERLWKFVKSEVLNAAYHGTFVDFKNAINNCIDKTDKDFKSQMDTLISEKVQLFDEISPLITNTLPVSSAA
jgi:transposase